MPALPLGAPRCCRSEALKSRGENLLRGMAQARDMTDFSTLEGARARDARRVLGALVGGG